MTTGALSDVRIVDFTRLYQGPLATQILADLGAEVIKVEPLEGEFMRSWTLGDQYLDGESVSFLSVNRNKRSVAVNLKHPDGVDIARGLIARSDVLIENFRPGVMDRLGLGYETLRTDHPRLIYCASSGFGQTGPYRELPGQDLLIQALGGTMWLNGRRSDPPTAVGFGIADSVAGLQIVQGVLAALYERERSGRGQRVDVNLLSSLMVLQNQELTFFANTRAPVVRPEENSTAVFAGAPLGVYETADGFIAIAMMSIGRLATLLGVSELKDLTSSNEIANRDEVHRLLQGGFSRDTTRAWLDVFREADIWAAPVQTFDEVLSDPQLAWNDTFVTIAHPTAGDVTVVRSGLSLDRTPATIRTPPPRLGEHTTEVLLELGFGRADVDRLVAHGVVRASAERVDAVPLP